MSNTQDSQEIINDTLEVRMPELIASDPRDRLIAEFEALLRDCEVPRAFLDFVLDCQEDALRRSSFSKGSDFASAAESAIDRLRAATLMGDPTMNDSETRSSIPLIVASLAAVSAIVLWVAQAQILAFALALLAFGSCTTWIHRETIARIQAQQALPGWLRVMDRFRSYLANEG